MKKKKSVSPQFSITPYNYPKMIKSAVIALFGLLIFSVLRFFFPQFDFDQYITAALAVFCTWLGNTILLALKEE